MVKKKTDPTFPISSSCVVENWFDILFGVHQISAIVFSQKIEELHEMSILFSFVDFVFVFFVRSVSFQTINVCAFFWQLISGSCILGKSMLYFQRKKKNIAMPVIENKVLDFNIKSSIVLNQLVEINRFDYLALAFGFDREKALVTSNPFPLKWIWLFQNCCVLALAFDDYS